MDCDNLLDESQVKKLNPKIRTRNNICRSCKTRHLEVKLRCEFCDNVFQLNENCNQRYCKRQCAWDARNEKDKEKRELLKLMVP